MFLSVIFTQNHLLNLILLCKKGIQNITKLDIDFECVDTDEAITMEDCVQINKN